MEEPKIIFFCGPHCSGKSSILTQLYEEGIFSAWGNEIDSDVAIPGYPVPKYSGTILSALSDSKNREEKKNNEF